MNALVPLTLFGWIPAVLALFALAPARWAVLAAFLIAWLFLPVAGYDVVGLPPYTKMTATSYGVLLGVALFDPSRLMAFRPSVWDVPMLVWCLVPFASSISNGLGAYDGASSVLHQSVTWGIPYFIGRLYFTSLPGLRDLAVGVVLGGLVYIPLCLYEIRMSPQLHDTIYGYRPHQFRQTRRFGGWRPMVFMQHGLAVGLFMAFSTVIAFWLWFSGGVKRLFGFPLWSAVGALGVTTVLCKSAFAVLAMIAAVGSLVTAKWFRTRLLVAALVVFAPVYMVARTAGGWSGRELLTIGRMINEQRAASLETRLNSEDRLTAKAFDRPLLGWGGHGRNLVKDERGRNEAIPDQFWTITLGTYGLVGLVSVTVILLAPPAWLTVREPLGSWLSPAFAPAVGLAMAVTIYMLDNLLNAMPNPIFVVAAGGLTGFVIHRRSRPSELIRRGQAF